MARDPDPSSHEPAPEHVEATVFLPDHLVEEFLDWCEEHLGQLPNLERVQDEETLGRYAPFYKLMAAQDEDRLLAAIEARSQN